MSEEKYRSLDLWFKFISTLLVISAGIWGGYKYLSGIEESYKLPYWNAQHDMCVEVSSIASDIALNSGNGEVPEHLLGSLFDLYFGEARLYLDDPALDAVGDIGSHAIDCIAGNRSGSVCTRPVFNGKAMSVANACRDMLAKSWRTSLSEISSDDFSDRFGDLED